MYWSQPNSGSPLPFFGVWCSRLVLSLLPVLLPLFCNFRLPFPPYLPPALPISLHLWSHYLNLQNCLSSCNYLFNSSQWGKKKNNILLRLVLRNYNILQKPEISHFFWILSSQNRITCLGISAVFGKSDHSMKSPRNDPQCAFVTISSLSG